MKYIEIGIEIIKMIRNVCNIAESSHALHTEMCKWD